MRILLGAGACLALVAAGLGATAAPASACPYGTTVNGIPCTPEHLGTCIGLAQSQG